MRASDSDSSGIGRPGIDDLVLRAFGRSEPTYGRFRRFVIVLDMSRRWVWAPFVIAFLGGSILIPLEVPIGQFLGVYNPLMGYAGVYVWAGLPISLVAAAASRTWRGLLLLVLGFATAGAVVHGTLAVLQGSGRPVGTIVFAAPYMALLLGFLGVPTYAIIVSAAYVIGKLRGARPSEGIGPDVTVQPAEEGTFARGTRRR